MLRPVRGVLCEEGIQTGDGRLMVEGSITWVDPPLPIAWLEEQMHGDLLEGAEQIGTLATIVRLGNLITFTGTVDDEIEACAELCRRMEAGSAPLGNRVGLSIDPDDWEVELVDTRPEAADEMMMLMAGSGPLPTAISRLSAAAGEGDPGGVVIMEDSSDDLIARYTRLRIRGVTACAIGAFAGTYMEFDDGAPAAEEQEPGTVEAGTQAATQGVTVTINAAGAATTAADVLYAAGAPIPAAAAVTIGEPAPVAARALVAAGGPVRPPSAWFADPEFSPADGRMFLQPDGHWACPHTVTPDGHVFGHLAGWFTPHNAYPGQMVLAPHSQTGYAAFLRTPLETAEGDALTVGILSMGCGHDERDGRSVDEIRAHYDGGPGAIRAAYVNVGEDEFGAWYSGSLMPSLTDDQVRQFTACGVSGDWREVWRSKGLDLVALLAGVTVPGFTVARGLAAAGWAPMELPASLRVPTAPVVRYEDGRPVVLLAAGAIRQPLPWERTQAALYRRLEAVEARLKAAEAVTTELRAAAASRIFEAITADATPV